MDNLHDTSSKQHNNGTADPSTSQWEKPSLKKLSLKDAQANLGGLNPDADGYS